MRGMILDVLEVFRLVLSPPLMTRRAVESLDRGVLLRLAWLDIFQTDTSLGGSLAWHRTDIFRAVVAAYRQGPTVLFNDLGQNPSHLLGRQR